MFVQVHSSVITLAGRGVQTAGLLCDSSVTSFAKVCGSGSNFFSGAASPPSANGSILEQQFCVKPVKGQEGSIKLEVVAGPSPPTRTRATHRTTSIVGRYALAASKAKTRKGRRGGGGWDDDDSGVWLSGDDWDGGNMDGFGGSGGGWNGGSGWNQGPSSGDDFFYHATAHCMWLWQLLCAFCLVQALHYIIFPRRVSAAGEHVAPALAVH